MGVDHSSEGPKELLSSARIALKERGLAHVLQSAVKEGSTRITNRLSLLYHRTFRSFSKFSYQGTRYRYLFHRYNRTWRNERAVEIPIIWAIVTQYRDRRILELGNVLSHYFTVSHDIVDKYEKASGIINQDIVDYQPNKRYDLIVGISTLEHVGWDEEMKDPEKPLRAVENLMSILSPNGKLVLTIPIGYNPHLDRHIDQGRLPTTEMHYLKRISASNKWREVEWEEIRSSKFHIPYHNANGLVIAVFENNGTS